jgi:hypothetical protein
MCQESSALVPLAVVQTSLDLGRLMGATECSAVVFVEPLGEAVQAALAALMSSSDQAVDDDEQPNSGQDEEHVDVISEDVGTADEAFSSSTEKVSSAEQCEPSSNSVEHTQAHEAVVEEAVVGAEVSSVDGAGDVSESSDDDDDVQSPSNHKASLKAVLTNHLASEIDLGKIDDDFFDE